MPKQPKQQPRPMPLEPRRGHVPVRRPPAELPVDPLVPPTLTLLYSELTLPEPRLGAPLSLLKKRPMESRMPVSLCLGRKPCRAWSMVLAVARYLEPCLWEGLFWDAMTSRSCGAAALSSWMVCSSSDSEGLSLKVLSSLPGASREKRRIKWGRLLGSAGRAPCQALFGSAVRLESVTAVSLDEAPLFRPASASPNTSLSSEVPRASSPRSLALSGAPLLGPMSLLAFSTVSSRFPAWFPIPNPGALQRLKEKARCQPKAGLCRVYTRP